MSYTIVYDRVFIVTPHSYTSVMLQGDSNMWASNDKRDRQWRCWTLGLTKCETTEKLNWEGNELFKYRGKWINTESFKRFIKNGIKNAKTIEEIYAQNKFHPHCRLEIWDNSIAPDESGYHTSELDIYAATTDMFEGWINAVKDRIAKRKPEETMTPVVFFDCTSPLKLVRTSDEKKLTKEVLAKYGKYDYVYDIKDGSWNTRGGLVLKAKMFPDIETAKLELTDRRYITFVDAESAFEDYYATKYCIRVTLDTLPRYFVKFTGQNLITTSYIGNATLFTLNAAEQKIASYRKRYKEIVEKERLVFEIVESQPHAY